MTNTCICITFKFINASYHPAPILLKNFYFFPTYPILSTPPHIQPPSPLHKEYLHQWMPVVPPYPLPIFLTPPQSNSPTSPINTIHLPYPLSPPASSPLHLLYYPHKRSHHLYSTPSLVLLLLYTTKQDNPN